MITIFMRKVTCPCPSDYGPDDTDFKRQKKSKSWVR